MEHGTDVAEFRRSGSFGQASSASSSLRRRSLSLSGTVHSQLDNDIESEIVSEAGDIGDRALHSNRISDSGSLRFSIDYALENGETISIPENNLLQSSGFWSRDPTALNTVSTVTPLPEQIVTPPPTKPLVCSENQKQEKEKILPLSLEYISCLIHLAVFGILGVLTRYLLEKLFGPSIAHVTSEGSILYLDLPSNMVGSFLMGWWGVVFKGDISRVSEYLAIGLTTGYLGSLTTFSGWNQKMLDLSVNGQWVPAFLGFFLGLFLAAYSIIFGIETAKGFRWLLKRLCTSSNKEISDLSSNWRVDSLKRHLVAMVILILLLGVLWSASGVLTKKKFHSDSSEAQLWLGCIVGPLGVWIRWFLARLNGRGLGRTGYLKWVPFGTLIANVSAACIMAALATVKKAVNNNTSNTVANGIQFGFLGCLSTVSTFIAEFNAMRESKQPWRAYAYALATVLISFALGILIYSVPVWARNYK
ncbi:fluoride export protein 1 [Pistacia vera]|uniref:fluoride export protein 1 n=1 Tax=Pistacia vera TaxID=55513 RepID=UPI001263E55D|nr:fluoride export protein 1 [Pistacia vera]XP_031252618.1 fluoride export protein 1 [Pistacia vera]XP_031252619.1 fluoride export protein 1 [Pistacia vera]